MIRHVTDYVTDHVVSENFHPLFFTITLYRTIDAMDNAANNFGSQSNAPNDPSGGDDRHGWTSNAGNASGKGKGKKRATVADMDTMAEEEADAGRRELMQHRDEALMCVQADIAAAEERIRMEELNCTRDMEWLFMLQALDPDDPEFEKAFEPAHPAIKFDWSESGSGPVGDEDDPVLEEPSERDPNELREGVSQ
jgi:hypothetical protein